MASGLPAWIEEIFEKYLTAEFSYFDGEMPRTIAVLPYYDAKKKKILITTSPAFYRKVECVKRNPRVSVLFSNSRYSGIGGNAVVLVQGIAKVNENIEENLNYLMNLMINYRECWKKRVLERMAKELMLPIVKRFMDWYVFRIVIEVKPKRLIFWRDGKIENNPEVLEVLD
jgi:hypothetical protein